jgi:agmatine deiminase
MTRLAPLFALLTVGCSAADLMPGDPVIDEPIEGVRRTPAEWEEQAAVWLQWPQSWEGAAVERSFVAIVDVVGRYEDVHLLAADASVLSDGQAALAGVDTSRVQWHTIANDNSWMRDNGPRYVEIDGQLILQNWEFDGWGGGFGEVPYAADNVVPDVIAGLLDLPLEQVRIVHERGDLEVNGSDTALVSWSVLSHRNPAMTKEAMTAGLSEALGVTSVVYIEGFDPQDGTRGHTDGLARFVAEDRVAVIDDGSALADSVAGQIAEQRPDLVIDRLVSPDAAGYANWLVGNGFVVTATSGSASADAAVAEQLRGWFPGRDVHFVDTGALWENGGGIHCVTNDEPAR